jgi:cytochrome c biogenesis protein CcmG/thiol:disulfide interchange protein DsbE
MKPFLSLSGFFAVAALLAFGMSSNSHSELAEVPHSLIGKKVPDFALPLLYQPNKSVHRSDLLGEPYLLNVFGSWCSTCQEEHPLLAEKIKPLGIKLVGIDWKDEPDNAKKWIAQFGNPYDYLLTDGDGRVAMELGVYKAPETFLVDAAGVVRYKRIGAFTLENIRDELLPRIAELRPIGRQAW